MNIRKWHFESKQDLNCNMAIGKNKKLSKKGKGLKKKTIDPLSRKEWFDLRAPIPFKSGSFGKTLVNKTSGQSIFPFDKKSQLRSSKEELLNPLWLTCRQAATNSNGERSSWSWTKLKAEMQRLPSMVWTLPEINSAKWSENGNPWLKPTWTLRLAMAISSVFS